MCEALGLILSTENGRKKREREREREREKEEFTVKRNKHLPDQVSS